MNIMEVLAAHGLDTDDEAVKALGASLLSREDAIADSLRMAGVQFGLYPQIVAEVLAEVEMGTPPNEEERALIRAQFVNLMEELRRQHGGGN